MEKFLEANPQLKEPEGFQVLSFDKFDFWDEDRFVKKFMSEFGIDNVRGGCYQSENLEKVYREGLREELDFCAGRQSLRFIAYVMKLQGNKYYVGCSQKAFIPYFKIFDIIDNSWLATYAPEKIIHMQFGCDIFEVNKLTKKAMARFGIDNVRGGSYLQEKLSAVQMQVLQHELTLSQYKCHLCLERPHFQKDCTANLDADGKILGFEDCQNCSEPGHASTACPRDNQCHKCGSTHHKAGSCREVKNFKCSKC